MRLQQFYPGEMYLVVATNDACQVRDPRAGFTVGPAVIADGIHVRLRPASEVESSVDVRMGETVICVGRTGPSQLLLDPARDRYVLLGPRGLFLAWHADPSDRYHQVRQSGKDRFVVSETWCRLRRIMEAR